MLTVGLATVAISLLLGGVEEAGNGSIFLKRAVAVLAVNLPFLANRYSSTADRTVGLKNRSYSLTVTKQSVVER
jgi:hypothetical protein